MSPTTPSEGPPSNPQQDSSLPRVDYYLDSTDETPVGLLRIVRHPSEGMWINHLYTSRQWQDDPAALQDIYPISNHQKDESLGPMLDKVPEKKARQM